MGVSWRHPPKKTNKPRSKIEEVAECRKADVVFFLWDRCIGILPQCPFWADVQSMLTAAYTTFCLKSSTSAAPSPAEETSSWTRAAPRHYKRTHCCSNIGFPCHQPGAASPSFAYSPDLPLRDWFLFPHIKSQLQRTRFGQLKSLSKNSRQLSTPYMKRRGLRSGTRGLSGWKIDVWRLRLTSSWHDRLGSKFFG